MNRESIYRLLNISENVPAEIVKRAFRNFAKHNHPDYFPGDSLREEKFKKVTAAYQSWKLVQGTLGQIRRLRHTTSAAGSSAEFKPWRFSCWA